MLFPTVGEIRYGPALEEVHFHVLAPFAAQAGAMLPLGEVTKVGLHVIRAWALCPLDRRQARLLGRPPGPSWTRPRGQRAQLRSRYLTAPELD